MQNLCEDLREQTKEIIDYEKKEMLPFIKKERKNNIVNKNNLSLETMMMRKNIIVQDHCHYIGKYRGTAHNICNLR